MKFGVGEPATRVEDPKLLRGLGRYSDDINEPGQARAYFVRSPYPSARILNIDADEALSAPGVLAVFTGQDVHEDGLGDLPCLIAKLRPQTRPDGTAMYVPSRAAIMRDEVAFVGDIVAMVVAQHSDYVANHSSSDAGPGVELHL